jgi:hypothetical protein
MAEPTNLSELIAEVALMNANLATLIAATELSNDEKDALVALANAFVTNPKLGGNLNLNGYKIVNPAPDEENATDSVILEGTTVELVSSDASKIAKAVFPNSQMTILTGTSTSLSAANNGYNFRIPDVVSFTITVPASLPQGFNAFFFNPHKATITIDLTDVAESFTWVNGDPADAPYTLFCLSKSPVVATEWEIY